MATSPRLHVFPVIFRLAFAAMILSMLSGGGFEGGRFPAPLLVPVLLLVVILAFTARRRPRAVRVAASPEDDLKTRYALGEITREQFQDGLVEMLKDRYVRGAIGLEEYERRVARVFSLSAL